MDPRRGDALGAGLTATAVEEGVEAEPLVLLLLPAYVTGHDPEDLGGLYPSDLLGSGSEDNFLHFHGPLQADFRRIIVVRVSIE